MKLIPRYIFFVIMYCTAYTSVNAQNVIEHFTIEDGLPSNEVHYVHQDSFGYFWFCTDRGISRYDGYEFTNFTTADGLTNNTVFKCFEDKNSNLWFTMLDGSVTIYDRGSNAFLPFAYNDWLKTKYKLQGWVHKIGFRADSNEAYFIMLRGRYDDSVHVFNVNGWKKSLSNDELLGSSISRLDNLEVIGVHEYGGRESYITLRTKKNEIISDIVGDKLKGVLESHGESFGLNPSFFSIAENLYCITMDGVYKVGEGNELLPVFRDIPASSFIKDREDMYWVTTINNGAYLFSISEITAISSSLLLPKNTKLVSAEVLGQRVLLGSDYKLVKVIDANGVVKNSYPNAIEKEGAVKYFMFNKDSTCLRFENFSICQEKGEYVYKSIAPRDFKLKPFKIDFNNTEITNESVDKNGELHRKYIAGYFAYYPRSLLELLLEHNKFEEFYFICSKETVYPRYLLTPLGVTFASESGVNRIFWSRDKVMKKSNFGIKSAYLGVSSVKLLGDKMVLGTKGHGVLVVQDGVLLSQIKVEDGLMSNLVNTLYISPDKNELWVGTTHGISVFKLSSDIENKGVVITKIKDITREDGLYSNYIVSFTANRDKLFAISNLGLSIIPLHQSLEVAQEMKLSSFELAQGDSIYTNKNLTFDYDQNSMEFRYLSISNKKVKDMYRYRLMTTQDSGQWYLTDFTSTRYNNLSPASYAFQVSARSQNTGWSVPEEYRFTIMPRFIDLWWVRSIGIAILLLIGYLFFAMRLKRLQDKGDLLLSNQELELQIARLESSALRGQMNPHFMFNVLNSIQKLILNEEKQDANKLLARFSKLVRSALQYSRLEYIPLTDEVKFLENYMDIEAQRFPGRFTYRIEVADELLEEATIPPLLIQPLCENAIKHAFVEDGGTIWVRISVKDAERMQIEVEDDGVGVSNTNTLKKSSLGTTIIRDRVKLIEKSGATASLKIELADQKNQKGTLAILILPYN
jgi:hypothetical protein